MSRQLEVSELHATIVGSSGSVRRPATLGSSSSGDRHQSMAGTRMNSNAGPASSGHHGAAVRMRQRREPRCGGGRSRGSTGNRHPDEPVAGGDACHVAAHEDPRRTIRPRVDPGHRAVPFVQHPDAAAPGGDRRPRESIRGCPCGPAVLTGRSPGRNQSGTAGLPGSHAAASTCTATRSSHGCAPSSSKICRASASSGAPSSPRPFSVRSSPCSSNVTAR